MTRERRYVLCPNCMDRVCVEVIKGDDTGYMLEPPEALSLTEPARVNPLESDHGCGVTLEFVLTFTGQLDTIPRTNRSEQAVPLEARTLSPAIELALLATEDKEAYSNILLALGGAEIEE